ncbi:aminotransferase class IV family protein [Streptomyces sp. NPDC057702]|uniref:aminotransferase class IV family protein n=1 Tax=unclassified Streptomyces TaxID=2593676 RepID=UPI0036B5FB87
MATLDGSPASTDDLLPLALTNFGHFTTMRVEADGSVRGLRLHLDRLARDCATVFGTDLDTGYVRDLIRDAVSPQRGPCVVRTTLHDPTINMNNPAAATTPRPLISVRPAAAPPSAPLRALSLTYERDLPEVKHVGLFGTLWARRTAQHAGYDDALFVGRDGLVSEGGTWNVGFVDDQDTVVWPQAPVLPGITMTLLQRRIAHRVAPLTLAEATTMSAAFATNVSIGVRPLATLDTTGFAPDHPVLKQLQAAYQSIPGEPL